MWLSSAYKEEAVVVIRPAFANPMPNPEEQTVDLDRTSTPKMASTVQRWRGQDYDFMLLEIQITLTLIRISCWKIQYVNKNFDWYIFRTIISLFVKFNWIFHL